jgi:hypothetical protein
MVGKVGRLYTTGGVVVYVSSSGNEESEKTDSQFITLCPCSASIIAEAGVIVNNWVVVG